MIYLDNSATTRPNEACVAAMNELLTECWFNPSSVYRPGMDAAHRLKTARAQVAQALGAETERVFFTSGGTEADNWAIFSTAKRLGKRGRHIVTTAVEHHAVLHPMQQLEAQGFEVTYLQPDETGFVSVEALKAALRPDTILVSIMMVNNESGAVMPIADMVRATRRLAPLALFHTDAVQGFLKVPFKAKTLGADLISISGHKVHGPKGVGALYIKPGLPLPAFIHGGGQEGNFRSGTENVPGFCRVWRGRGRDGRGGGHRQNGAAARSGAGDFAGGSGTRADRGAGSAAHCEPVAARRAVAGDHQLSAIGGHFCLGGFSVLEGAQEPRAGGDEAGPGGHRRVGARVVLDGERGAGCLCAARGADKGETDVEGIVFHNA